MLTDRITIKDIAAEADCHYSLVSLALREETADRVSPATRKRILEVCNRLKYRPDYAARQLVSQKSNTLVFALPFFAEMIASEPYAKMISGVMSGTTKHGLDLHFLTPLEGKMDEKNRELLYGKRISGIVTAAPDVNDSFLEELNQLGVAVVVICSYDKKHKTHHVYCDNEQASFNVVTHLIQRGHEQIAFIKGPVRSCDANSRFEGYLKALKKNRVTLKENLIVGADLFTPEHGYKAAMRLFSRFEKPSAIFCANDDLATGCLKAMKEANIKCPEEISVVGFDNISITNYTNPPLTTVEQPFFDLGRKAVDLIVDIIKTENKTLFNERYDAKLILRESVCKI